MRLRPSLALFIAFCLSSLPGDCGAERALLWSGGVRGGLSGSVAGQYLHQYEAFVNYRLPWELRTRSGWGVATELQGTAGAMSGAGEYGFIGSLGPAFRLGSTAFPLQLDLGVSAAVLSRDTFGPHDFNGYGHFVSHAGLDFRFNKRFTCGYRFQHMSNAGFNGKHNPGLNLHLLGLSWSFYK